MGKLRLSALVCLCVGIAGAATSAQAAVTIGPDPLPKRTGVVTSGGATIYTFGALPGGTIASPIEAGAFANDYPLVNADIEPDCDGDGLGDETQDPEIPATAACGFLPETTPPLAPLPPVDSTDPVGSKLRFHPGRLRPPRRTSLVTYRLSEGARVLFAVKRWRFGRLKGERCVFGEQARQLAGAKKCKVLLRLKGGFTRGGRQGSNRFRFRGRLAGKQLPPGRYRLVAVPIDPAGNRGNSFRASFAILR